MCFFHNMYESLLGIAYKIDGNYIRVMYSNNKSKTPKAWMLFNCCEEFEIIN